MQNFKYVAKFFILSCIKTTSKYIELYYDSTQWSALSNEQKIAIAVICLCMLLVVLVMLGAIYEMFKIILLAVIYIVVLLLISYCTAKKYNLPNVEFHIE